MARYRDIFEASTFKKPNSKISSSAIKNASGGPSAGREEMKRIAHERRVNRIKDLVKVVAGGGKHSRGQDGDVIKFDTKHHDTIAKSLSTHEGVKVKKVDGESHIYIDPPKEKPFLWGSKKK